MLAQAGDPHQRRVRLDAGDGGKHDGQSGHQQHDGQISLGFLVALGERCHHGHQPRAQQRKGRQHCERCQGDGDGEIRGHPQPLQGHKRQGHHEGCQRQQQGHKHIEHRGQQLAQQQFTPGYGQGQQGLQRSPLPLAGGGVDGQIQAAHEHGKQQEIGEHAQQHHRATGRRGHIDLIHGDRPYQPGIHATHLQTQRTQSGAVAFQEPLNPRYALLGLVVRLIKNQCHPGWLAAGQGRAEVGLDPEHHVGSAGFHQAPGGIQVRWARPGLQVAALKKGQEIGCVLCSGDRQGQRLIGLRQRFFQRQSDQNRKQRGAEQRTEYQGREQGAPIPRVVQNLFPEHVQHRRHDAASAAITALTNVSSRFPLEDCCARAAGVPAATTWPAAMITMSSHRAATSCMMWDDSSTQ